MIAKIRLIIPLLMVSVLHYCMAQDVLTMKKALDLGLSNYGTIKARSFQVEGAKNAVAQAQREYLPNLVLSGQQVYGTVNGQNGPLYGFGGFAAASSGLPLPTQNWNAGFGSLYLANMNWEVFSFGRARGRIRVSNAALATAKSDLSQEQFQHLVRVAAAYLNAIGTRSLAKAQQKNLSRAQVIQKDIVARAKGGLRPGVDSAQANAEVAAAKIAYLRAADNQQEQEQMLAFLIGVDYKSIELDTLFAVESPGVVNSDSNRRTTHPTLNYYQSRVEQFSQQEKLGRALFYPSVNFVGIIQTRGSGFSQTYAQDQSRFTGDYATGIKPTISNYLLGIGVVWNLTSIYRASAQVKVFKYNSLTAEAERQLVGDQLKMQSQVADAKLLRAIQIKEEAPIQVSSATDAYIQRTALYRNGLTNLVDITQAMYALTRAESDRDLAFINLWQALLLKAAAEGDINIFTDQVIR